MTSRHEIATVEDLERVLDEHPEIRERIRRKLLTDEERALPRIVAQLAEDLRRLTEAVAEGFAQVHREISELKEGQQRLEGRQERLEGRQERLEGRQERLEGRQERLEGRQERLEGTAAPGRTPRAPGRTPRAAGGRAAAPGRTPRWVGRATTAAGESQQRLTERFQELHDSHENLRGTVLEQTAARRLLPRITQELRLRRPQIIKSLDMATPANLLDALDRAVDEDRITVDMATAVAVTDLIMQGISRDDATPVYVLAEVSGTLNQHDIDRAQERAAALETATGQRTLAAVAAVVIPTPQQDQASAAGVSTYLLG